MNESERIRNLEERLHDVERLLDKICDNSDVCSYKSEKTREEGYKEETPIDRLKKYL